MAGRRCPALLERSELRARGAHHDELGVGAVTGACRRGSASGSRRSGSRCRRSAVRISRPRVRERAAIRRRTGPAMRVSRGSARRRSAHFLEPRLHARLSARAWRVTRGAGCRRRPPTRSPRSSARPRGTSRLKRRSSSAGPRWRGQRARPWLLARRRRGSAHGGWRRRARLATLRLRTSGASADASAPLPSSRWSPLCKTCLAPASAICTRRQILVDSSLVRVGSRGGASASKKIRGVGHVVLADEEHLAQPCSLCSSTPPRSPRARRSHP